MSKVLTLAEINESSADDQANIYFDRYQDQMDVYSGFSCKSKINESISPYEIVALGQQLDQFMNYQKFCESQGNLGALGAIPQIALDVITASVGASIIPLFASMQPMAEEHGIVYYKQIQAVQTSGGYTAGEVISDPRSLDDVGDGTLGSQRKTESLGNTVGADVTYNGTFANFPIRPYRLEMFVGTTMFGKDDGAGNILGLGFSGTVNYTTGAWSIVFAADPLVKAMTAMYDIDTDGAASIEKIKGGLQTKDIRAEIWALAADVGAFANFAFSNRFGRSATDEVAADLTNEITRILNTQVIKRIYNNIPAGSNTVFDQYVSGISYAENKLTFIDSIAQAESKLHAQSGASTANRIMAGKYAAAVLRGMPDFQIAPDAATVAVGLYGFYDGVPVCRATGVIPDKEMVLVSNAGNYFNAPLAYAPFMPLMVTNTVQSPNNPFRQTTAAGVWSGMTALNGNLSTKITVDDTPA